MPVVSASESESESTEDVLTLSKGTSAWTVTMCPKPRDSIKAKIPGIKSFIAVQNAWTPTFKSSALVHVLHDRYGYPKVLDFGKTVAWIIPNVDAKEYKKALRAVAADVVPNWSFKVTFKEKNGYKLTKQSLDKLIAELADDDTSDSNEASSESSSEEKPATPPEEKPATPPAQRKQKRPRPSPSSASSAATRIVVDSSDEEKEATTPLTAKAKGKRPARPASLIPTEAEEEDSDEDGETGGASSSTSRAPRSSKSVYRRR
uniref:Uncharacterized protein n=1 Tax=Emiliania huxleyi TaxID=2903 RepID=A0A7S3SXQ1_EMIHU